jgi:peptidoglycan/LPS O-acetylase OafA/YrhL
VEQLKIGKVRTGFRGHIDELDGVRAIGMLLVLINHFWPRSLSTAVWDAGLMAWIAMDSFFVLSGFLIAGILLDSRDSPQYYRSYYTRRALRIFPLYYVVVLWMIGSRMIWDAAKFHGQMLGPWGSPVWFLVYLGNVKVALNGSWPPVAGFTPLWSLQVEEQFYLLLPFVIRNVRRNVLVRSLSTAVVLSPLIRIAIYLWNPANRYAQYVLLPCHMEGLAWGALIALRFRRGPWRIGKVRLAAFAFVLLAATCALSFWSNPSRLAEEHSSPFNRTFGYSLSSLGCAALVLWLIRFRGSRWTGWLRMSPFLYLGKISYGVYLLHIPVREVIHFTVHHALGDVVARDSAVMFFVLVAASIGSAALSWHVFERPLLALAAPPPTPPRRSELSVAH